eukprot:SAG11_NODE_1548_length_4703_cov_6.701564_3_plen_257_part_00
MAEELQQLAGEAEAAYHELLAPAVAAEDARLAQLRVQLLGMRIFQQQAPPQPDVAAATSKSSSGTKTTARSSSTSAAIEQRRRRVDLMAERAAQFEAQGYVVVDDLVFPEALPRIEAAARRLTAAANSGTLDEQFGLVSRTGAAQGGEATSIRGLLSPEWGCPEFAEFLGSEPVVDYVRGWLGLGAIDDCGGGGGGGGGVAESDDSDLEAALEMWSYYPILLCSPNKLDVGGSWHRDARWSGVEERGVTRDFVRPR